jgi:hypothetical protein
MVPAPLCARRIADHNAPHTPFSVARRVGAQLTTVGRCKVRKHCSRRNIFVHVRV